MPLPGLDQHCKSGRDHRTHSPSFHGLRAELTGRRAHQVECQSRHDTLVRAAEERRQRLATIDAETKSWTDRGEDAKAQLQQLDERREALDHELERLDARPDEIAEQRRALLGSVETAEEKRKGLADHLAETDTALGDAGGGPVTGAPSREFSHDPEHRVRHRGPES